MAPRRTAMTDRAGRWACRWAGSASVADVARALDCDWHTVDGAVVADGAAW